ncbi:MAG: Peroxisomal membrane protein PMP27 [Piccolia ochrophora]|nr:MAG: Peroxisomal membrane protein PMP27 [Piccolia ochrophora]
MVADALVYHPTVAHYLRYVATTVGRDKLLRTLQYFSRFYAWYLFRTNHPTSSIAPYEAIKKHFGLSRKLMRVGKNVEHFKAAATAADAKGTDPVLRYCAVGRQLGYAVYLSLDTITYLDAASIRPSPAAKSLQRNAYRAWLVGLLFSAASGTYTLQRLASRQAALSKKDGEGAVELKRVERDRDAARWQLVSDVCDMTIPGAALGWGGHVLDDGLVGLAGTVSSVIGVWGQWRKTA